MGLGSRYPTLALLFIGAAIFLGACSVSDAPATASPSTIPTTVVVSTVPSGDLPQAGASQSTTTATLPSTTVGSTIVTEQSGGGGADEESGDVEAATVDLKPLRLPAGTCFNDPPADAEFVTPDNLAIVACESDHDNEVYGNLDIGGGGFPGDAEIERRASSYCLSAFELYVATDYEESTLDFSWYFPTDESWSVGGTAIICFAYNADLSPVTGSIEGSGL